MWTTWFVYWPPLLLVYIACIELREFCLLVLELRHPFTLSHSLSLSLSLSLSVTHSLSQSVTLTVLLPIMIHPSLLSFCPMLLPASKKLIKKINQIEKTKQEQKRNVTYMVNRWSQAKTRPISFHKQK